MYCTTINFLQENRVQESEPISEPADVVPPSPRRWSRIFHPPKRYLDILTEDVEEASLMGDRDHRDDSKIYNEAMLDVDS